MAAEHKDAGDLEKVRRHIQILIDLGKVAGESSDLESFLDQAVVQVARAVEINHAKVLRYRPDMGDLIVAAGVGWKPGVVRTATLSADLRSAPGRSFQIAEPVVIHDFAKQDEYVLSNFLKQHGIVSLVNAPVVIGGSAWGVVEVDSTTPRDFSVDTVDFLVAAGAIIGSAVRFHAGEPTSNDRLAAAVSEAQHRETLLREMQHRVKNNFQLILSAITQQKQRYKTRELHGALDRIAERINAISIAHAQLAPSDTGQKIKLADYLRALCTAMRHQTEGVEIDVEADEIELGIDRAVPLGLILNEAVTNSIKYAFADGAGRVTVKLQTGIGYGEGRMTVSDNGQGAAAASETGSGLKLIAALARQIGGSSEVSATKEGTRISVKFPILP